MVKNAGAPDGPDALRPLNEPQEVRIITGANGRPEKLYQGRRRLRVALVSDAWRVEDEWWRDRPVSRTYFDVQLEDGRHVTLFQDAATERWYVQRYA